MNSIEGQTGVGVSAHSLVDALRVALGKTADREEASKSFNRLRATRPVLQNLQTVTISRRCGEHETPALRGYFHWPGRLGVDTDPSPKRFHWGRGQRTTP